jgi:monoterpene epsilon-lactone hydrolase
MRLRPTARMLGRLARSGLRAGWSRADGPALPSWGLRFEALMRAMQAERDDFEAEAARAGFAWQRFREDMEGVVPPATALRGVRLDRSGGILRLIPPEPRGAVLYVHGGGFTGGSFATHADLVARIALASGATVWFPEYRRAPEHPFPAALDDVRAAWSAVAGAEGPDRVVVMGDSAGGGLTFALALALRDDGEPLPAGLAGLSPWVDLLATAPSIGPNRRWDYCSEPAMHGQREAYARGADARDPRISPLYGDLHGLPPMLVQVGGAEMLRDDGARLVEKARAAGVQAELRIYDDMPHVWHVFAALIPQARDAVDEIGRFVRRRARAT